jgi:hypothetical protein
MEDNLIYSPTTSLFLKRKATSICFKEEEDLNLFQNERRYQFLSGRQPTFYSKLNRTSMFSKRKTTLNN